MSDPKPDTYDPKAAEPHWLSYWESERIFKFDPDSVKEIFSIDTPPPTVSGRMHIGHAFSYSQQDIIARYKRLRGFNVFYPFGTDDNGLPTERLVEKMKDVKGAKMERQAFIKLCEDTLAELRPEFVADWKRLGVSCDFSLFYSTINEHCRRSSQWSFIDLYKKGRAYRKEAPVLWCPECVTAIAQAELQDKEKQTELVHIEVRTEEGKPIVFATTRPELYPSCVGMSVHPDDVRYKDYVGKSVVMPLTGARVTITTDAIVDPAFGSGVVYFCSSGDAQFLDWETRHPVEKKIYLLTPEGRMNANAGKYAGLSVNEARRRIVEDLNAAGVVRKVEPLKHTVNAHERCGTVVEYVSSRQWFIKYLDLKDTFLKLGEKLVFHPDFMRLRYENWVRGLKWDWCVSRQRFFGVPFPVWYCRHCGAVKLADVESLPVDPLRDKPKGVCDNCRKADFEPERDVLDTWATSSLTPMIAAGLMSKHPVSKKLGQFSLRPQGHDIISTWLFYTIAKGYLHNARLPWTDAAIAGWVLDPLGKKMSKSKGNVIAPQELITKYSADALRIAAGSAKLGEDSALQEKELVAGQKFVTKFWNASKFAAVHIENMDVPRLCKLDPSEVMDWWVLHKLSLAIREATDAMDAYEYARAKSAINLFFWRDFCDNYLELVKDRLYESKSARAKESAQGAIARCLSALVRLYAPFAPFICEEIYHRYLHKHEGFKSVHLASWPKPPNAEPDAERSGDVAVAVLAAVRKQKSERKLSIKAPVKRIVVEADVDLGPIIPDLRGATCAAVIEEGKASVEIAPGVKADIEF